MGCGQFCPNDSFPVPCSACDRAWMNKTAVQQVSSVGSSVCTEDSLKAVMPKQTKAQRCWICGKKLYSRKSYPREIDGYVRDLHKFCSERSKKEEDLDGNAFGMEY